MPVESLKASLLRFQTAVQTGDGPGLTASLNELESLLAAHHDDWDPRLVHFLEGRSYAKALAWLNLHNAFGHPATPPGGCSQTHQ